MTLNESEEKLLKFCTSGLIFKGRNAAQSKETDNLLNSLEKLKCVFLATYFIY